MYMYNVYHSQWIIYTVVQPQVGLYMYNIITVFNKIKASTPEIIYVLEILFDLVFITWCFPPIWCEGMITPIFKLSKKKDPNYYRSICVSSCLGKLFCTILNDRILNYTTENDIIHPSEIGFLPGNRIADHIFTLRMHSL